MIARNKAIFISASLLLYGLALILPCYNYHHLDNNGPGWSCLVMGWLTFGFIPDHYNPFPLISWASNLPFYIGLLIFIFSKKQKGFKISYYLLLVSFLMSLGALVCYGDPERTSDHFSPNYGCFIWIFSQAILCFGAWYFKKRTITQTH